MFFCVRLTSLVPCVLSYRFHPRAFLISSHVRQIGKLAFARLRVAFCLFHTIRWPRAYRGYSFMSWLIRSDVHNSVRIISMSLARVSANPPAHGAPRTGSRFSISPSHRSAYRGAALAFLALPTSTRGPPVSRVPSAGWWRHGPRTVRRPAPPLAAASALFFPDLDSSGGEKGWSPASHLASVGDAYAPRVRRDA